MKRITTLLLIFMFLFSSTAFTETYQYNENYEVPTTWMHEFELSAWEWLADEESRALLSWLLSMELLTGCNVQEEHNFSPMPTSKDSYVFYKDGQIATIVQDSKSSDAIIISYVPGNSIVIFTLLEDASNTKLELISDTFDGLSYKNDTLSIYSTFQMLQDVFAD